MFGVDQGAYILAGTIFTQAVVVFGIVYAGHNARRARVTAESTNEAVNHVGPNEPKLIDQVRGHGKQLDRHAQYHQWTATTLATIADQIGVPVPPLPQFDQEDAA